MADESANTASFVRRTSRPSVAHAAWLSRMAARRRPNEPRRSASTPMATSANTMPHSTAKARFAGEVEPEQVEAAHLTPPFP